MSDKEKLISSAQKFLQKKQLGKAIKDYQKIAELDPKDIRNRLRLADLYIQAGQPAEAMEQFEAAARFYAENGFVLKAIAVYKQMQKLDPERIELYHKLADLNARQGLTGNALAEYRLLVARLEKQGLLAETIGVLLKMKQLDSANLNLRAKIIDCYLRSEQRNKGLSEFHEVIRALREQGDTARIVKFYEIFLPAFSDLQDIHSGFARALIDHGDSQRGIELLEDLRAQHPEDTGILTQLVTAHDRLGNHTDCYQLCRELLRLRPEDHLVRESLLRACLKDGRNEEAIELLAQWEDEFMDAGRGECVKSCYEQLRQGLPSDPRVLQGLKNAYQRSGQGDKLLDLMAHSDDDDYLGAYSPDEADSETADTMEFVADQLFANEPEAALDSELLLGNQDLEFTPQNTDLSASVELSQDESLELELEGQWQLDAPQSGTQSEEPSLDLRLEADAALNADARGGLAQPSDELELPELVFDEEILQGLPLKEPNSAAEEPEVRDELEELELPDFDLDLQPEPSVEQQGALSASATDQPAPLDLEEIDFYLEQGLLDEVEQMLLAARASRPQDPAIERRLVDLQLRREGTPPATLPHPTAIPTNLSRTELARRDNELSRFKQTLQSQIDEGDAETHFNLGIAYKEMGLLEDALQEFEQAAKSSARRLDALTLKAICLRGQGNGLAAELALQTALNLPDLGGEERCNLHYEMALIKEERGQQNEALKLLQQVAAHDPRFRDVGERLARLGETP